MIDTKEERKARNCSNIFLKIYNNEKEGQINFFSAYKKYIASIKDKKIDDILIEYSDGVINGNILEFKLVINDINRVLFQVIKYLSKMRIKGIPVPANILLISLNTREIYKYNSADFLKDIEKTYIGASSKNNENFYTIIEPEKIYYNTNNNAAKLIEILREEKYVKININEDCILGWAERFYREHPKASKGDFIGDSEGLIPKAGEIREPYYFQDYIIPYEGKSNEKFKYLMDCLNDKLKKKELGAFYTPIPYCKKAVELVREAIKLVPIGNDYIILDRCSGTGNLESVLSDEELSHCVLSTYEYYEYKILIERLGEKVRYIIPPTENEVKYREGSLLNADALSEEYVNNEYLQEIINNPKITIILFENPPYRDNTSNTSGIARKGYTSFVKNEMRKEVKGAILNDLANNFIWAGFKYYLRQPTDSYIIFSPVKYFKSCNLSNKTFKDGFLFNRKYFHASHSAISCIWWQNINKEQDEFNLKAYDIETDFTQKSFQDMVNNGNLIYVKDVLVKKVYHLFTEKYYDKILKNGIAYMRASSFNLDSNSVTLTTIPVGAESYSPHGFLLQKNNFIEKLPLFCAKLYPQEKWYERDVYFTTADKGEEYIKDKDFLKFCLIYTCLSRYNKCLSFIGSNNRYYKNELCFEEYTLASEYIKTLNLNNEEKKLIQIWNDILKEAKNTKEYKKNITYGVYQIEQELNTFYKNDKDNIIYNYPELNGKLKKLKLVLKNYYKDYIQNKLFEYELLK
ncbi:MAG: hypothetical protein LBF97_08215 [Elusimicrobiota bacterium]|jgi:hypothetical protein|nr:hypothetical protein [Elusimicrobiota bacterium]